MEVPCGLLTVQQEPVPLKSIDVELEVRDHVASVASILHYENKEENPIETVFVFPMPGDAAVCHFSATVGQTQIVAEVKEKQEAQEEYDDALSSGQQAFLLDESEQSPDVFALSVGCLPPGQSASIRLEYVIELAVQPDDGLRFCLPAVLNPRYQSAGSESRALQMTPGLPSPSPYSLSLSMRVSSSRPVTKVESNCSLDPLQYLNKEKTKASVKLSAGHKFDRDVQMTIYYKDALQAAVVVEAGQASAQPGTLMGDPVVMLSLYPELPHILLSSVAPCGEFVFLVDRSASMDFGMDCTTKSQSRISSAQDTLMLLLKSLPMGCYFNIYSFGDNFEHVFPKSVKYSQKTMKKALKNVEEMRADLGGTEILEPLEHIYSQHCIRGQPRQVFVFTDGEINNTKEVIDLVRKNSAFHRCFTFGIGDGVSSALINGMAKEGGGQAQFILEAERMQPKVMQSLQFALQPVVEDVSVMWDLPEGVTATLLSPPVTALFKGQRTLIYAQLSGQNTEAGEGCLMLKYSFVGHTSQNQIRFGLKPVEDTGLTIHRLGARTLIRSLEMKAREEEEDAQEQVIGSKQKAVELSVQSGVSSAFTAFIAVNKSDGQAIQGSLLLTQSSPDLLLRCSLWDCIDELSRGDGAAYMRTKQKSVFSSFGNHCKSFLHMSKKKKMVSLVDSDPFLQLVSLQEACGCWLLSPALAAALGKTSKETEKSKPVSVRKEVWATILALLWLHGLKSDVRVEWELLAMKAVLWLRSQKETGITECVEAGNALLGCELQKDVLGI